MRKTEQSPNWRPYPGADRRSPHEPSEDLGPRLCLAPPSQIDPGAQEVRGAQQRQRWQQLQQQGVL